MMRKDVSDYNQNRAPIGSQTDRRSKRTKKCLKNVFLNQLNKKDIDKITVTALCHEADINRSTFYQYYCDIYALLEDIQKDFLEQTEQFSDAIAQSSLSPHDVVVSILQYIYDNKELLSLLLLKKPDDRFMAQINSTVHKLFRFKTLQSYTFPSEISEEEFEDVLLFLTSGFYSIYKKWILNGCKEDIHKLAAMTSSLTTSCLCSLLPDSKCPLPEKTPRR